MVTPKKRPKTTKPAAAAPAERARPATLARLCGVSRQAIHDLIDRRILPPPGEDGKLDVAEARAALENGVRPSGKTAGTSPEALSYQAARARNEAALARLNQIKVAELEGQLKRADVVRDELAKLLLGLRNSMLQIPARLAPILAAEASQAACRKLLDAEIRRALNDATDGKGPG